MWAKAAGAIHTKSTNKYAASMGRSGFRELFCSYGLTDCANGA
jgi:hypothetical protein